MLQELSVLSSSFSFSNSNYNYDNTNTNVSAHLCSPCGVNPAHMAKNKSFFRSVGTRQPGGENDPLKAKAQK